MTTLQCQKTYLADGRCANQAFGASQWCRWHKIIEEFRADLSRYPRFAAQSLMFGSSYGVWGAGYCAWKYAHDGSIVWLLLAVVLMGGAAKYFADGCIAQDHPFSQFALWGKLLAFGLVVEITAGGALIYLVLHDPLHAEKVIDELSLPRLETRYIPLLTTALILEIWLSARLLGGRVLFVRRPAFNTFITITMLGLMGTALRPLLTSALPLNEAVQTTQALPEASRLPEEGGESGAETGSPSPDGETQEPWTDRFWRSALGERYWPPLLLAWLLGFVIAEIVNKQMRSRADALPVFRATVWPSFPVCYGSPILGAVGSRFVMVGTETQNPWLFVPIAVSIAAGATAVGTRLVVGRYLADLRRHRSLSAGNRAKRQELLFFFPCGSKFTNPYEIIDRFASMTYEINLALEYSGTGSMEGYSLQQGFLVMRMVGSSADSMFSALNEYLQGISIPSGSFAVKRYGDGSQETMIEL